MQATSPNPHQRWLHINLWANSKTTPSSWHSRRPPLSSYNDVSTALKRATNEATIGIWVHSIPVRPQSCQYEAELIPRSQNPFPTSPLFPGLSLGKWGLSEPNVSAGAWGSLFPSRDGPVIHRQARSRCDSRARSTAERSKAPSGTVIAHRL